MENKVNSKTGNEILYKNVKAEFEQSIYLTTILVRLNQQ